jgi:hypothetical protein
VKSTPSTIRVVITAAAVGLTLTACATPRPEPKIVTQVVKVPVTVACIPPTLNLDPTFPDTDSALRASPGAADMLQLLAAGRLLRVQTMAEWRAALLACR